MTTVYFAGGEDSDFLAGTTISVTGSGFRTGYARCSLSSLSNGYIQNPVAFTASTFWSSARWSGASQFGVNTGSFISWHDSSGIKRLSLECTNSSTKTWTFYKVDASAVKTQLGSTFVMDWTGISPTIKVDVYAVVNSSGTIQVYWQNTLMFTYTGDTTTNSVTSIAFIQLRTIGNTVTTDSFSEVMVMDQDTRACSLQTLAPVANGNTHNFDTGTPAAANVNEITLSDVTLDGSTTAGQIDQYTMTSLIAGTWTIMAVGVSARAIMGTTGPTKMDVGVRSTSDYWSSDFSLTGVFANGYSNWWTVDPNTSLGWAALPSNIGLKSVA